MAGGRRRAWTGWSCCLALLLAGCRAAPDAPPRVPPPEIVTAESWGSDPAPIPESRRHEPRVVTLHHAGVAWKAGDDPHRKVRGLQSWGRREKGWPDVPYHFLVAPDGRVFEGRPLAFAGETNTEYDTSGHALVQLFGNFEEQRVRPEQLRAAVQLVAWLCQELGIDPATIAGHRDWSRQTACPGRDLDRYLADGRFEAWVRQWLSGRPPAVRPGPPLPGGPTRPIPR